MPSLATTATPESPVGEYPITAAQGTLDNNYTYTFVNGILTINPAPATVTAKNISRPYGAKNPELTYTISDASGAVITIPGMRSCYNHSRYAFTGHYGHSGEPRR